MTKAELQGHKAVKIDGQKFIIRKINPVIDFPSENMPQIFTALNSRRDISKAVDPKILLAQMMMITEAALISPVLVPIGKGEKNGKEDGITIEDIFRDQDIGARLFSEVMIHALDRFKGIKSLFFCLRTRFKFWTASLEGTAAGHRI